MNLNELQKKITPLLPLEHPQDPEQLESNHWLDRALANCFMATFLCIAAIDAGLNYLCRKLKGRK